MTHPSIRARKSKTGIPGITVILRADRTPRYAVRTHLSPSQGSKKHRSHYLGSFGSITEALEAQQRAHTILRQGDPLPSAPRWREQVGTTGIKSHQFEKKMKYMYEVNVTQPNGKVRPYRSRWFESEGEALVARIAALERINTGEPMGRDGAHWKDIRYPTEWLKRKLDPPPPPDMTMKDWIIVFYRKIVLAASIPKKDQNRYKAHLLKHIIKVLNSQQVRELDEQIVALVDQDLDSRKLSESKKTVRTTLWRMMEAAVANGLRSDNPVVNTPLTERRKEYQQSKARRCHEASAQQTKDSGITP